MSPSRRVRLVAMVAALLGATAVVAASPAPAGAQSTRPAQIRLAHFSPDTQAMDVYVTGFDGQERRVLDGLSYSQVSQYLDLDSGVYAFSMRPAGTDATTPAVVTESAELAPATAYTFAALGPSKSLATQLFVDDLTPPPTGRAAVRLVHATSRASAVTVTAMNGPVLADGLGFAQVSEYAMVPGTPWTLAVTADDGTALARQTFELSGGQVVTLVVADDPATDGVRLVSVVDATGTNQAVSGGLDTGGGGTATRFVDTPAAAGPAALVVAASLVVGLGLLGVRVRPRRRAARS